MAHKILLEAFRHHTNLSSPGQFSHVFNNLNDDLHSLMNVVQGLFVHCDYLDLYGDPRDSQSVLRETLSLEARLQQLLDINDSPITESRPVSQRAVGTCRDYALMLCGMLREKSVPARLRCGFATYFTPGRYEDHWLCEAWNGAEGRWVRADAQLDDVHRTHLDITFDPADVPKDRFLTAHEAYRHLKEQNCSHDRFGHGGDAGLWLLHINLARDYLSLMGHETSDWDRWREARGVETDHETACHDLYRVLETLERDGGSAGNLQKPEPYWLRSDHV